jgi:hypothetical protein
LQFIAPGCTTTGLESKLGTFAPLQSQAPHCDATQLAVPEAPASHAQLWTAPASHAPALTMGSLPGLVLAPEPAQPASANALKPAAKRDRITTLRTFLEREQRLAGL